MADCTWVYPKATRALIAWLILPGSPPAAPAVTAVPAPEVAVLKFVFKFKNYALRHLRADAR